MNKVITLFFLLIIGYLLVVHVNVSHPMVLQQAQALVQQGVIEPIQETVVRPLQSSRLLDWIPQTLGISPRRYVPNPYGYGGLDPSGGERKGGHGLHIPDAVEVGWWKGEQVTYPDRRMSPVQDGEEGPKEPKVADVGWWGEDWLV